jgi:hypothetical protein
VSKPPSGDKYTHRIEDHIEDKVSGKGGGCLLTLPALPVVALVALLRRRR